MQIHDNAVLTVGRRSELAACSGLPLRKLGELFNCSRMTAGVWVERGRRGESFEDRSSRPHTSPKQTPEHVEAAIIAERLYSSQPGPKEPGPDTIAARLRLPASTCYSVLRRYGLNRRSRPEREPKAPPQRYQWALPGQMLHVDIKKLGRFAAPGHAKTGDRSKTSRGAGWSYLFVAVDDASRIAFAAFMPDERASSAVAFLKRARRFYRRLGIKRLERVLTDNGSCFRSRLWKGYCLAQGAKPCYSRPYHPQTNGKAERLIRTMLEEWAYAQSFTSDAERERALEPFLYYYNTQRHHLGLGGQTPAEASATCLGSTASALGGRDCGPARGLTARAR